MTRTVSILLALAVLATLGVLYFGGDPAPPPSAVEAGERPTSDLAPDPAAVPADASSSEDIPSLGAVPDAPTRTESTEAEPHDAVVQGRCVDREGQPLEGVRCELNGWPSNDQEVNEYEIRHGSISWDDPEAVETGSDGRFVFSFRALPPYQLSLSLTRQDLVESRARWTRQTPGTIDVGDVELVRGVRIEGTLLDTEGKPLGRRTQIHVDQEGARGHQDGAVGLRDFTTLSVRENGTFRSSDPLVPGDYVFTLNAEYQYESGKAKQTLAVEAGIGPLRLLLTPPDLMPAIRGRIVDEAGQPVARVFVSPQMMQRGSNRSIYSDREGRFVIPRPEGAPEEVRLGIRHDGIEPLTTDPIAWGGEEVEIRVQPGVSVELLVTDARDGSPVEKYQAFLTPDGRTNFKAFSSSSMGAIGGSQHPEGRVELGPVPRGRYALRVVPAEDSELTQGPVRIVDLEGESTPALTHILHPAASQGVLVTTSADEPLVGAEVELLYSSLGEPIDTETRVLPANSYSSGPFARVLDRVTTGPDGRARLHGSPQGEFGLRVLHSEHAPLIFAPFRFEGGETEIRVVAAATLHLAVGPPAYLEALREEFDLYRQATPETPPLEIRLYDYSTPGMARQYPRMTAPKVGLDREGKLSMKGVPAGTWTLMIQRHNNSFSNFDTLMEEVRLAPGETRSLELDLSDRTPLPYRGRVFLDGAPYADGRLELAVERGNGVESRFTATANTDAEGRFETRLAAGVVKVTIWPQSNTDTTRPYLTRIGPATGRSGEARIEFALAERPIVLVSPDGAPLRGAPLLWQRSDGGQGTCQSAPTDGKGCTVLRGEPGLYTASIRIRSLLSDLSWRERMNEIAQAGGDLRAETERVTLTLGPVTLEAGQTEAVTLRLPANWDR